MLNKPHDLWTDKYTDRNTIANKFIYKYCYVANLNPNREDLFRLNNHCDTFVVGSDVVWNYDICGKGAGHYFYLDFVLPDKKKIAYASSFGIFSRGDDMYENIARYYLSQFDAISVRENDAVKYIAANFSLPAQQVLDPVFICDPKHYYDVIKKSNLCEGDFFVSYVLGHNSIWKKIILYVQECLGYNRMSVMYDFVTI